MKHYYFKKGFYSSLNMEDFIDADYKHAKRVLEDLEIENVGQCHYLFVQSDTLTQKIRTID